MANRHPLQNALGPLLLPLSFLYGKAALIRRRRANQGKLAVWRPPLPCVSVGNISWGGTGKTPITDWLLAWAERKGLTPAVLTRGYGAKPPHLPLEVTPKHRADQAGDEPLMLAQKHPHARILVDPIRSRAGRAALSTKPQPDFFVLDDGFQHVQVARSLNLVLLDADDLPEQPEPGAPPSNWNRVLPAGTWREPAAALADAHAFLIKTDEQAWPKLLPHLNRRLGLFPLPVFAFTLQGTGLRKISGQNAADPTESASATPGPAIVSDGLLPAAALSGPYALVSGVGNPASVRRSAELFFGRAPERERVFPDHYAFTAADAAALDNTGIPVVCTAKDAVKLAPLGLQQLYILEAEAVFFASANTRHSFLEWWEYWWNNHKANYL